MKNERMLGRWFTKKLQQLFHHISSHGHNCEGPQLKAKGGRHQETLDLGPFTYRSLGKSVMFLDVFNLFILKMKRIHRK